MNTIFNWKNVLNELMRNGNLFRDYTNREGKELLNVKLEIENTSDVLKPIEILQGINEWVYPSPEEIKDIILTKVHNPYYEYDYGPRIFNFQDKLNQIDDFVLPLLRNDPNSRRAIVILWDSIKDSNLANKEVPGLILVNFRIYNNKLNISAVIRSNEMFVGWPTNVYQLFVLQEYVADKLNMEKGKITTFSNSAHIYLDQIEEIKKVINLS